MAASAAEPDPLRETSRYERVQSLGKGAFGFVQLGRKLQNNELAAIKFLKRGDVNKYVESEILNHRCGAAMLSVLLPSVMRHACIQADPLLCPAVSYDIHTSSSLRRCSLRRSSFASQWSMRQAVAFSNMCNNNRD